MWWGVIAQWRSYRFAYLAMEGMVASRYAVIASDSVGVMDIVTT